MKHLSFDRHYSFFFLSSYYPLSSIAIVLPDLIKIKIRGIQNLNITNGTW